MILEVRPSTHTPINKAHAKRRRLTYCFLECLKIGRFLKPQTIAKRYIKKQNFSPAYHKDNKFFNSLYVFRENIGGMFKVVGGDAEMVGNRVGNE